MDKLGLPEEHDMLLVLGRFFLDKQKLQSDYIHFLPRPLALSLGMLASGWSLQKGATDWKSLATSVPPAHPVRMLAD